MTEEKAEVERDIPEIEEQVSTRQFTGEFGGVEVSYTATAATQIVDTDEDNKAVFFYVSYLKDDADAASRPVMFAFNGGPGSSSVWLHLGFFGPKRIQLDDDGFPIGTPGRLTHNEESILDVSDIVLIDAVGTGFSKSEDGEKQKDYYHFAKDIEAFSDFIVTYLNKHGRWESPKYLAGESYGTTRGAAIAHNLYNPHGIELNGVVLISSVLNFQTISEDREKLLFHPGNDLPFMLHLPTYAATAWYHRQLDEKHLSRPLREFLDEVEEFAIGPYWSALALGDRLDDGTRSGVAAKLAEYTGLPPDYIERYDLRIHINRFCKELLRDQKRTVGRIDSRYTGIDRVADGDSLENDPSTDLTGGPMTSALNHYLREEIGFESASFYEAMSMKVNEAWDYEDFKNRYVDTSEKLRDLLSRAPQTRVLVANGYFDLATPHFATEYTFSHMGLDESLQKNVHMEYFEAGHMMYAHKPSRERLAAQLREFVEGTR